MMDATIEGYIVYRLQLQPQYSSESNSPSRKRPRRNDVDHQRHHELPLSSSPSTPCWRTAGYYLIVQRQERQQQRPRQPGQQPSSHCHPQYKEYLLSLPLQYVQQLMMSSSKTATTATTTPSGAAPATQESRDHFCCHVRILDYTVVSFIDTKIIAKEASHVNHQDIALLQVHHMEALSSSLSRELHSHQQQDGDENDQEEEKKESDSQETLRSNSTTTSLSSVQYYSQPLTVEEQERERERKAHRQRQQQRRRLHDQNKQDDCNGDDDAPPPPSILSLSQLKYQECIDQQQELIRKHNDNDKTSTPKKNNKRKRLQQQQQQEEEPQPQSNTNNTNTKKKQYYNVVATVDSISPIIAMDPTDPFALMEMYDDDDDDCNDSPNTVVVVLKGSPALQYHDGIQPGQKLLLQNVQRKSWPIVDTIRNHSGPKSNKCDNDNNSTRLLNRIPSYVLVVSNSNQIIITTSNNNLPSSPQLLQLPPLPSTPVPLISVRGIIVNVEHIWLPSPVASAAAATATGAKHGRHQQRAEKVSTLHWIEIEPLLVLPHQTTVEESMTTAKKNGIRYRLYLTHYPLSPSNQLCLPDRPVLVGHERGGDPRPQHQHHHLRPRSTTYGGHLGSSR